MLSDINVVLRFVTVPFILFFFHPLLACSIFLLFLSQSLPPPPIFSLYTRVEWLDLNSLIKMLIDVAFLSRRVVAGGGGGGVLPHISGFPPCCLLLGVLVCGLLLGLFLPPPPHHYMYSRDQWFWQNFINLMCNIKFWKGNANLRSVYKKPFLEIFSGFFHFWPFFSSQKSSLSLLRDENFFSLNRSNGASKNPSFRTDFKNLDMIFVKSEPKKSFAQKNNFLGLW